MWDFLPGYHYLLKAEDARKIVESPRLARLQIRPEKTPLKPNEKTEVQAEALDQYGQPYPLPSATWAALGGVIGADILYLRQDILSRLSNWPV